MMAITRGAAPASLAQKTAYNKPDVVDALHQDFLGKCYLCEGILPRGSSSVEHRVDQSLDPSRVYDWTNLYPAHQECNNRRPETRLPLLCPGTDADLEKRLVQIHLPHMSGISRFVFTASDPTDLAAEHTAAELNTIHCGGSRQKSKWTAEDLRADIERQIGDMMDLVQEYFIPGRSQGEQAITLRKLRALLSRSSPYTMLKRSRIKIPAIIALFD